MHFVVGDSLGYDNPGLTSARFYSRVESNVVLQGKTYFKVRGFPIEGALPKDFLMREDEEGNVLVRNISSDGTIDPIEMTLYKAQADVGTSWYFNVKCTLESRTDTVRTTYGVFTNCLRINIGSHNIRNELHWLGPNIGLVKREYRTITMEPIWMPNLDLKDVKLKN